jgi:Right handed beta helix region
MKIRTMLLLTILLTAFAWMAPVLAYSATYHVATSGKNSYSCTQAQSASTPKLTIGEGIKCSSAGDTLVINTGTYLETITGSMVPSGTSKSARTKVIGNAGAKWTIKPPSESACASNWGAVIRITDRSYIEISDFIIDGRYGGTYACANGIVLNNANDIHHAEIHHTSNDPGPGSAILFASSTSNRNHISHLLVHDIGESVTDHCTYYSGNDNIIEYTRVYNCTGHGIHYYDNSSTAANYRNIIRWNDVHNVDSYGIGVYFGSDNQVYGNMITNGGVTNGGIRISSTANVKVYNNTIYNVAGYCIRATSTTGAIIRNNACVGNANNSLDDSGTSTTSSNNRFTNDDTVFVNASNGQFSPRAGSVLIDAGTVTALPSGISFIGSAPDQGAIEFAGTAPTIPNTPSNLQATSY